MNWAKDFPQITVERGIADKYLIPWDKTNWLLGYGCRALGLLFCISRRSRGPIA